jgi:hypothetical protein
MALTSIRHVLLNRGIRIALILDCGLGVGGGGELLMRYTLDILPHSAPQHCPGICSHGFVAIAGINLDKTWQRTCILFS